MMSSGLSSFLRTVFIYRGKIFFSGDRFFSNNRVSRAELGAHLTQVFRKLVGNTFSLILCSTNSAWISYPSECYFSSFSLSTKSAYELTLLYTEDVFISNFLGFSLLSASILCCVGYLVWLYHLCDPLALGFSSEISPMRIEGSGSLFTLCTTISLLYLASFWLDQAWCGLYLLFEACLVLVLILMFLLNNVRFASPHVVNLFFSNKILLLNFLLCYSGCVKRWFLESKNLYSLP